MAVRSPPVQTLPHGLLLEARTQSPVMCLLTKGALILFAGVVPDGVGVGFLAVVISSGSDRRCFAAVVLGVVTLAAAFVFQPSQMTKSSSVMLSPGTTATASPIADATLPAACRQAHNVNVTVGCRDGLCASGA